MRKAERWMGRVAVVAALSLAAGPGAARPRPVVCQGAAMLGGAQLACSHVDPQQSTQLCTYSWALATPANETKVVSGSFLMPRGAAGVQVFQGTGYAHAMSPPIVQCQGRKGVP